MMIFISLASARWVVLLVALVNWVGTVLWIGIGRGGFGRHGARLFNWHPVLASCAMLVLFPHGFLAWRNRFNVSRVQTKRFHAILMITAFVLLNVAVSLAYFSRKQQKLANFYSLHSWVGMCAVGTMKGNIIGGLLRTFSSRVREMKLVAKLHRLSGVLACALGFMAMLLGFAEEQGFVVRKSGKPFGPSAIVGGALGLTSLFVGALVTFSAVYDQENNQGDVAKDGNEEVPRTTDMDVPEYQT